MQYKITNRYTGFNRTCSDMLEINANLILDGDKKEFGLVKAPSIFQSEEDYISNLKKDRYISVKIIK